MNQKNLGGSIPPQPIRKRRLLHLGRPSAVLRHTRGMRDGMGSIPRSASAVLGILLVFFGGIFIGRYLIPAAELSVDLPRFVAAQEGNRQLVFPTFWEAWDKLHAKYIGDISEEALFYGAVSGMIQAAGDPYTAFAEPADTQRFEETIEGSFSGVGIEIGLRSGLITVIAPLSGSPAEQAGIREGDIIVKVDEEELKSGTNLDEVVSFIRGKKGTTVTLTVVHKDDRETTDIDIVRDTIEIESVKVTIEDGIAHLTLTSFNGETATQFNTAARQMVKDNVQGIILDLRNNPGGFLNTSVELASRFLPKDTLVVTERGKKSTEYRAEGNPLLADIPYVVLVNEGSASASEILAGALSDQDDATIVGTTTFGKGSVQEFIKLKDGSSLRITIAKWFTPSGHNINDNGIEPDVEVKQDFDTEEDEPLLKAQEVLRELIE